MSDALKIPHHPPRDDGRRRERMFLIGCEPYEIGIDEGGAPLTFIDLVGEMGQEIRLQFNDSHDLPVIHRLVDQLLAVAGVLGG